MSQELNELVQGLRNTSQRLHFQSEAIADAISRLGGSETPFQTTSTNPPSSGQRTTGNNSSPPRFGLNPPRYESTRRPGVPRPNSGVNDSMSPMPIIRRPTPFAPSGGSSSSNPSRPTSGTPFSANYPRSTLSSDPRQHTSSMSPNSSSGGYSGPSKSLDSGSTFTNVSLSNDPNGECLCGSGSSYDNSSTLAEARFRYFPAADSSGGSSSMQTGDYPDILRNLVDWWSAFFLENLNSDGAHIADEASFIQSLSEILNHWREMSRR